MSDSSWLLLVFIIIAFLVLLFLIRNAVKGLQAKSWPVTTGMIIASEVVRSRHRDSDGQTSVMWKPQIVYEYEARGETYQSDKISTFGSYSTSSRRHAYNLVGKYPRGERVKVYCNPTNDLDSVLEPGVSKIGRASCRERE